MGEIEQERVVMVSELDPNFKYQVAQRPGGEAIRACFACGTCTAGCPVRAVDEKFNPRRIIRMALLGMKDRVLTSDFVWLCTTCYTCQERCPQGVKITEVMNILKNLAVQEGYVPDLFKEEVKLLRNLGVVYELDNKRRERYGLPPLNSAAEDMRRIFEITGLKVGE